MNSKIKELAGQHDELALKTLSDIAGDINGPSAARVSAAIALLDRAHGKPAQSVDLGSDPDRPLVQKIERVIVHANRDSGSV